jgi:hypothetical protein
MKGDKKINMRKVVWGAKLPNGKMIGGGNLDILNKKSVKKFMKNKTQHRHKWEVCDPECPSCGYYEECCSKKDCTTCRDGKTKEIVCD